MWLACFGVLLINDVGVAARFRRQPILKLLRTEHAAVVADVILVEPTVRKSVQAVTFRATRVLEVTPGTLGLKTGDEYRVAIGIEYAGHLEWCGKDCFVPGKQFVMFLRRNPRLGRDRNEARLLVTSGTEAVYAVDKSPRNLANDLNVLRDVAAKDVDARIARCDELILDPNVSTFVAQECFSGVFTLADVDREAVDRVLHRVWQSDIATTRMVLWVHADRMLAETRAFRDSPERRDRWIEIIMCPDPAAGIIWKNIVDDGLFTHFGVTLFGMCRSYPRETGTVIARRLRVVDGMPIAQLETLCVCLQMIYLESDSEDEGVAETLIRSHIRLVRESTRFNLQFAAGRVMTAVTGVSSRGKTYNKRIPLTPALIEVLKKRLAELKALEPLKRDDRQAVAMIEAALGATNRQTPE
jgi:hypothetical protein